MIWEACNGPECITPVAGILFRLVESQEQVASLSFVDTLEEQALLEDLLEKVKPNYPTGVQDFHYLLKTPFRYPPLKWGSRFGAVHEPSIFYGGTRVDVVLAESAYYRWVFWHSMDAPPIKDNIRSEHTLFSVGYKSAQGIKLQAPPFNQYQQQLTHPKNYTTTQTLGASMRAAGVDVFEYTSARDLKSGTCVGLFNSHSFSQKKPKTTRQWLCELNGQQALFKPLDQGEVMRFSLSDFLYEGQLPWPA
ncbi:MAG: hypothetical protein RL497_2462 [Pseudomonadota bacterium]